MKSFLQLNKKGTILPLTLLLLTTSGIIGLSILMLYLYNSRMENIHKTETILTIARDSAIARVPYYLRENRQSWSETFPYYHFNRSLKYSAQVKKTSDDPPYIYDLSLLVTDTSKGPDSGAKEYTVKGSLQPFLSPVQFSYAVFTGGSLAIDYTSSSLTVKKGTIRAQKDISLSHNPKNAINGNIYAGGNISIRAAESQRIFSNHELTCYEPDWKRFHNLKTAKIEDALKDGVLDFTNSEQFILINKDFMISEPLLIKGSGYIIISGNTTIDNDITTDPTQTSFLSILSKGNITIGQKAENVKAVLYSDKKIVVNPSHHSVVGSLVSSGLISFKQGSSLEITYDNRLMAAKSIFDPEKHLFIPVPFTYTISQGK